MSKQMLNEGAFDLILIYQFLKRISTPFDEQPAFKLGIIDEKGDRIKSKKLETKEEKNAYGYLDRLIFNLKKIIEKVDEAQEFAIKSPYPRPQDALQDVYSM